MPIEMKMLVWTAALAVVQTLLAVTGAALQVGLPPLVGNREKLPECTGWVGRAQRAHRNLLESFAVFAALVLVAQITGRTNPTTALGAQMFFWARLVYAPVYVAGIPWLRTGVWSVGALGVIMILLQLL